MPGSGSNFGKQRVSKKYYLTRPTLPSRRDVDALMDEIWDNKWLTNFGPIHNRFEAALEDYLGVGNIALVNNCTTGLMLALKALGVHGEVITTPYTFIATVNAILWAGLTPVFVDVDPETLNINPDAIESAITQHTVAILPVHLFGRPCEIDKISTIAERHNLKVIYDAAHTMGGRYNGRSIVSHGNMSVLSFHATKGFSTFEGGAVYCEDVDLKRNLDSLANFGLGNDDLAGVGLNGKMNEICAAMGLAQLPMLEETISARKVVAGRYDNLLEPINGVSAVIDGDTDGHNFLYYPVRVLPEFGTTAYETVLRLKERGIDCRRYFNPLACDYDFIRKNATEQDFSLQHARAAADSIVCLPLYPELTESDTDHIIQIAFR